MRTASSAPSEVDVNPALAVLMAMRIMPKVLSAPFSPVTVTVTGSSAENVPPEHAKVTVLPAVIVAGLVVQEPAGG